MTELGDRHAVRLHQRSLSRWTISESSFRRRTDRHGCSRSAVESRYPFSALAVIHECVAREQLNRLPRGGASRYRCEARHTSRVAPSGATSLAAWTMTRLHRFATLTTMLALSYVGTDPGVARAAGRSADCGRRERPPARAFSPPAVTGSLCSSKLQQAAAAPVAQPARLGTERVPRAQREARL